MKGLFFNAQPTTDIIAHPSGYDREYDSDDFNRFMGVFFGNGVFVRQNADACKVSASGLTLAITPGIALVDGGQCHFEPGDGLTLDGAGMYSIMCRRNNAAEVRDFELVAVKGEETYPAPVRDGDIIDLCLAHVLVEGGAATVSDTREDRDLCGFAALTGQPPYYPPDEANLPYILWLYTLGLPMTEEQREAVEGNPSLMEIFNQSRIVKDVQAATQKATREQAEGGIDNSVLMTPLRTKEAIDALGPRVLLKTHTTTVSAAQVDISLADISFTDYQRIEIYLSGSYTERINALIRFNGKSTAGDYVNRDIVSGAIDATYFAYVDLGANSTYLTLECGSRAVSGSSFVSGERCTLRFGYMPVIKGITFANLTQMNLVGSSGAVIPAGTQISIYGVRK